MNRRGIFATMAVAVVLCIVPVVGTATPVSAAATYTTALYDMNEATGATVLVDSSGNGVNGTIGTEVQSNAVFSGATGHRYAYLTPNTPPAHPQHLDSVPGNTLLDAGTSDYAVTVRYRTTRSFGNLIQKGQNKTSGGYFKIELPTGRVTCLYKGSNGQQRAVTSAGKYNDGAWHVIRCERLANAVSLFIDGVLIGRLAGTTGSISNNKNLSIAGKTDCDQLTVTCDYFVGDIDYVRIEKGSTGTVNTAPTASFTDNCTNTSCSFNGSASADPGGSISTYAWDFGDNTTGTGVSPTHEYALGGTYPARLTVTDNGGLTGTTTRTITVTAPDAPPTAAFTSTCADYTCTFDGSGSSDANGPIADYVWDFADTSSGSGATPSHTFPGPGGYDVALVVTDGQGATGTVTHTVTIAPNVAPIAAFSSSCTGLVCTFDASASNDANGPIASYDWQFGDGEIGTGVTTSHTYAAAGDYDVALVVTDSFAETGTVNHTVSVAPVVDNIAFVGQTSASANATAHVANVPSAVQAGDGLLLFFSTGTSPTVSEPTGVTGWVPVDTLTNTNGATRVWRKVAGTTDAGAQVRINLSALTKGNIMIVAYSGTSATDPVVGFASSLQTTSTASRTTPQVTVAGSGSWVISYWMHRDSSSTSLAPPGGVSVRSTGTQSGGGRVTTLLADSGAAVPPDNYGGLTATANTASTLGTTWTIVLAPA